MMHVYTCNPKTTKISFFAVDKLIKFITPKQREKKPMEPQRASLALSLIIFNLLLTTTTQYPSCQSTCGSLHLGYPFGSGPGCGSPTFQPYITCTTTTKQLLLTTHTGSYPITSISYSTNTLTLTPPSMSTCTSMRPCPSNLGLDWASPFQLGPSTFVLLSCQPPTSSLTLKDSSSPICDPSYSHLCAAIYTCPSVTGLDLSLFPPTNTCCVYSPGNLDAKGELDLRGLKCKGYTSVVSLGDYPTDPNKWEYGVALEYNHGGGLDGGIVETKCKSCEMSGGVCGYATSDNSFLCVCKNGDYNTTSDCSSDNYSGVQEQGVIWSPESGSDLPASSAWKIWFGLLALADLIILTA